MWPDQVSNPGPLTYESGALPTALLGPATPITISFPFVLNENIKLNFLFLPYIYFLAA